MNSQSPPNKASVFRNWISFIGMVVGLGALFAFLLLFVLDALSKFSNPYVSILTYMGVPAFLIGGIVLMFFGAWRERRRRAKGVGPTSLPTNADCVSGWQHSFSAAHGDWFLPRF